MFDQTTLIALRKRFAGRDVLSVYLNTDAASGLWKDKLYKLERALADIEKSLPRGAAWAFDVERQKVRSFLDETAESGQGIAIFSSAGLWETITLRTPIPDIVRYRRGAYLGPLVAMLDEHQRYAIALVDNQNARLFLVQTGEIEERREVQDRVPKRHGQIEHAANVERRHAHKVEVHLRNTLDALVEMHRRKPFNRLVLAGASEALPKFEKLLPRDMAGLVVGLASAPMYASDSEVVAAAAKTEAQFESVKEKRTVGELITRAAKRNGAVLGAEQTLLALRERRIFELIMALDAKIDGCVCDSCGLASPTVVRACPICGSAMRREDDLVEVAVNQALEQGLRIETVCGPSRGQLVEAGALGALISYASVRT